MKSMTGFGKATYSDAYYHFDVEMKSVNHRFLDIQLRLPKELAPYELTIRQCIKKIVQRGRVEVHIALNITSSTNKKVVMQWDLIHQLIDEIGIEMTLKYPSYQMDPIQTIQQVLNNPEYVQIIETQLEDQVIEKKLLSTVHSAVEQLENSRAKEGQYLQECLDTYMKDFSNLLIELSDFITLYEAEYKERLKTKINHWLKDQVEESRLLTEVAILLEKGDIHEELDRLAIHIKKLHELLIQQRPTGRELDFQIQEMNREVNTIGSKSTAMEIKNLVVQMKTVLEKIREQVQNIE